MNVFKLATSVLNNLDSAAKDVLEEPKESAKSLRAKRNKNETSNSNVLESLPSNPGLLDDDDEENDANSKSAGGSEVLSSNKSKQPVSPRSTRSSHSSSVLEESKSTNSLTNTLGGLLSTTSTKKPTIDNKVSGNVGNSNEVADLRKSLRKKNQEIEKLHEECLELEEQNTSLKSEVQEAWDHYKQSQERAAARELELLDEMKDITQSKSIDKQQYKEEIYQCKQELSLSQQLYQQLMDEKLLQQEENKKQQFELTTIHQQYTDKIEIMEKEISELQQNTNSNVFTLQKELLQAKEALTQLQYDSQLLINNQQRKYTQLEEEYHEISQLISKNNHHNNSSSGGNGENGTNGNGDDYRERENITLQHEVILLTNNLNTLQLQYDSLLTQYQIIDKDKKLLQLKYETDKSSYQEQLQKYYATIQQHEQQLLQQSATNANTTAREEGEREGGKEGKGEGIMTNIQQQQQQQQEYEEMKSQYEQLSKMLLSKQQMVIELQAERSALKSRVYDITLRLTKAETKLTQQSHYKDDDDDDEGGEEEAEGDIEESIGGNIATRRASSSGNDSGLISRRNINHNKSGNGGNSKEMLSDLEKIGMKPSIQIKHAVSWIDSWTMFTGHILRVYPLIRLGFVLYLLILHLWVFFILIIHTHSLEGLTDPRDAVKPKMFVRPK